MNLPAAVVTTALFSGLYTCAWGAFKDSPYEGFRARTFPRSMLFSLLLVGVIWLIPSLRESVLRLTLFQTFFLIMGLERSWTEIYKGCFRRSIDPGLFLIPQQVTFFGRRVESAWTRALVGLVLTAMMVGGAMVPTEIRSFPAFLVVAFLTGIGVSIGGAYKDAPFEGFQPLKFFRSSLVLAVLSPLFYFIGPAPLGLLVFIFGGMERLVVEYYKSYLLRSVPGKFRPELQIVSGRFSRYRPTMNGLATAIAAGLVVLYYSGT